MKKPTIIVAATALIAFCLGYFLRGMSDRTSSDREATENSAIGEHSEGLATQAQTIVHADPKDKNATNISILDYGEIFTTTRSSPRAPRVQRKRDRLVDFFEINGIGHERAEQIIQDLVDADHYIVQKQNAMMDRHTAEKAGLIAQGGVVGIGLTQGEAAALKAERDTLYRRIFGEYFEAHEEYRRSHVQRLVVASFSSNLPEPLDYATRETMVRIMYEENARFLSELDYEPAESGEQITSPAQGWEAQKDKYQEHLAAKREFYDRVMDRTAAYLTALQAEQFKRLLDNDIRRFELLIELGDVEEAQ